MEQVVVFGKPVDHYRAKMNGKYVYFNSLPIPRWLPQSGYRWVDDKLLLSKKLNAVGIPSPRTIKIKTLKQAKKAFEELQKPLILKPEWGSRGRHTTTNIHTVEELEKAYDLVKQIAISVVVQEHLVGSVYRATVIDNKLVGFFRADQPQIVGDGVSVIEKLIEEKNTSRRARVSEIVINDDLKHFIARRGYALDSVLPQGEVLSLSAKTGRMYGSYTKEMFPEVHPKMHGIFESAGRLCEAPILGFDLIMEDGTKDPDTQRWGVIECNSLPFIDLHYMALEGEPINLAKNVWDLWIDDRVK
jgi:D-alanine-D-alanine ligase-like ATP-grasp enzyme